MAQLVSGCGGRAQNGGYLAEFYNLAAAVLDVYPITAISDKRIDNPPANILVSPFTWDNAEVYVQTVAEEQLRPPSGAYLVPVGGAIELAGDSPVYVEVQVDPNATAQSRASQLLIDYVVDNLKQEVPDDSIVGYTTKISDCVNAAFLLWTSLNREDSGSAPDTISTALTTYTQCKDLQLKLTEDPASALYVPAARTIDSDGLNRDLSVVADHAEQDDWPSIVDDLIGDAGKVLEDIHG